MGDVLGFVLCAKGEYNLEYKMVLTWDFCVKSFASSCISSHHPALSSACILGGYGYTVDSEKGLASLAVTGSEINISLCRYACWLISIWIPFGLFTVSANSFATSDAIPILLVLIPHRWLCAPSPAVTLASYDHEYKRSGSITIVNGRRSSGVWLTQGDAVDGKGKVRRRIDSSLANSTEDMSFPSTLPLTLQSHASLLKHCLYKSDEISPTEPITTMNPETSSKNFAQWSARAASKLQREQPSPETKPSSPSGGLRPLSLLQDRDSNRVGDVANVGLAPACPHEGMALYYTEAIRSEVPELVRKEKQGITVHKELSGLPPQEIGLLPHASDPVVIKKVWYRHESGNLKDKNFHFGGTKGQAIRHQYMDDVQYYEQGHPQDSSLL
ncbi:hypothetical protein BJ138DRAFT_1236466 [Hygrophoropsis aurantiaca]|uniref:Uncharacterized protein n=1 Tax=Hygrophoropsis aurantiaca TaxID=72124 RepID=A0ACB7ZUB3_9AGAM|nr:hypothetical protein BJ138DRAFT_1236466 [Hygrophoropsis aurantiaca]